MNPMEPIAIIGMAGRFPGAPDVDRFWQNLRDGVEAISSFSNDELLRAGIDPDLVRNPQYVASRAIVDDTALFDAAFFNINPREAEVIDPQHRLFLECAWEALENAGYDARSHTGSIGVYGGVGLNLYLLSNLISNPEIIQTVGAYQTMLASDKDFLTTRVSYKLNLRGPSVDIQTACSTSLVAVQFACQGLLTRQCDVALAGGVSLMIPQRAGYLYQLGMILSPDGHCRAFDAEARGTVPGEGVGIVVLKRLADALADGDSVRAVIKGAAVNNDGSVKVGYTAPSVDGQAGVISMAQAMAGVEPDTVSYVEAHGTATELGDPIEIAALTRAFQARTSARGFCAIGSVKSNIGHLDAAAGVAGLIKTVLALEHGFVPPSLHYSRPNPRIDFANSPFFVNAALRPWPRGASPRRAGVSSFGIGGTNAHVVLEEAPLPVRGAPASPAQLLTLSARTPAALERARTRLATHLQQHASLDLADVAFTLQRGRRAFAHRAALVCRSLAEAAETLTEEAGSRRLLVSDRPANERPVAFLFPGQGSQYVNMARGLYEEEPTFRAEVDACAAAIAPSLGVDLRTVLYPSADRVDGAEATLRQTSFAQPALFIIEYALAALWMRRGLLPAAMIGHSIGEYVAACLAGVLSLDDALTLVVERGRLMQIPGGGMIVVPLPEEQVARALGPDLSIAASNAPSLCVVSGPEEPLAALEHKLKADGLQCQRVHTAHAFHSAMMAPALAPFREVVERVRLRAPAIPYVSNVTGTWITEQEATDPDYYVRHLRGTVRFSSGLSRLLEDRDRLLLEVGPGTTLASLTRQHQATGRTIVSSLRHPQDPQPDTQVLLTALGRLWVAGAPVDWSALHAAGGRRRVPLPSYPFERQRYWVEPRQLAAPPPVRSGSPHKRADIGDWLYAPSWRRSFPSPGSGRAAASSTGRKWLVFADDGGMTERLVLQLAPGAASVATVTAGSGFGKHGASTYTVDPSNSQDMVAVVADLAQNGLLPDRVLHAWSLTGPRGPRSAEQALDLGYNSVCALVQGLHKARAQHPIEVTIVTNSLQDVVGDAVLEPTRATILGAALVIGQENPNIVCRTVDVVLPEHGGPADKVLVEQLLEELASPVDDASVAYRASARWVRAHEPVRSGPTPTDGLLRERGVYLITGGLGGIGLVLAEHLARTARARLVLVGRRTVPPPSEWDRMAGEGGAGADTVQLIRKLQGLKELGADVMVVQADVADREAMRGVLDRARREYGALNGVIHAAGIAEGGLLAGKTRDAVARVMRAKVAGTLVLEELLHGDHLDVLILCSSISTTLGGLGLSDYAGANSFLDAFARSTELRTRGTVVSSMRWDAWREVGMATQHPLDPDAPAALRRRAEELLENAIAPAEGVEAFARCLRRGLNEVVISTRDLPTLIERSRPAPIETETGTTRRNAAEGAALSLHQRRESQAHVGLENEVERTIADIWQNLLGVDQIGATDDFFELGGHSLLATQVLSRLQVALGVELSLRLLFEARTVRELAQRIHEVRAARTEPRGDDPEREEIEL